MDPTILVVDDDPHLREVIADALSDEGYSMQQAADGEYALAHIARATPDLVLSDVAMPRLSGVELAAHLTRQDDPVPIVLMSATAIAPPAGVAMFLRKPFGVDELLALVASTLGKSTCRNCTAAGAMLYGR